MSDRLGRHIQKHAKALLLLAGSTERIASAQAPQVIEAAAPGYPRLPSGGRDSGEVRVKISIAASGEVVSATALSGPDRLRRVAEGAARKWRFKAQDGPTLDWVLSFGVNLRPGLGEPPLVAAVFKQPDRIDVLAEELKVVTISDPPVEDVGKARKKQRKGLAYLVTEWENSGINCSPWKYAGNIDRTASADMSFAQEEWTRYAVDPEWHQPALV